MTSRSPGWTLVVGDGDVFDEARDLRGDDGDVSADVGVVGVPVKRPIVHQLWPYPAAPSPASNAAPAMPSCLRDSRIPRGRGRIAISRCMTDGVARSIACTFIARSRCPETQPHTAAAYSFIGRRPGR